jgi:hypothetical protein
MRKAAIVSLLWIASSLFTIRHLLLQSKREKNQLNETNILISISFFWDYVFRSQKKDLIFF